MVILFVIDNYLNQSNGTVISTKRFAENLKKAGHDVRILSAGALDDDGFFSLEERKIFIVSRVAKKQDVIFSKPNKQIIDAALDGVDVVHLVTPWKTSRVVCKIAKSRNIAITASFHIQPENITYGMNLGKLGKPVAYLIYKIFKKFYKKVSYVHCPSQFILSRLKAHKYPNSFKVISNGVSKDFFNQALNQPSDRIQIISVGRYAKEKRQDIVIKAVSKSKYKDNISLILAGLGPKKKALMNLAQKQQISVTFDFYTQKELIEQLSKSYLYIHAADIEIEGISSLEAISVGITPIISNSKMSATKEFAIEENNLFEHGDSIDLAKKIDYWIEHQQKKELNQEKYKEFTTKYDIDNSISLFEKMLHEAVYSNRNKKLSLLAKNKIFRKQLTSNPISRSVSLMFYYVIALPLLFIFMKFFMKLKIIDNKNLRKIKGGAIMISNHVHTLDSVMNALAAFPKKTIFTTLPENFKRPVAGKFVKLLGAIPIPTDVSQNMIFFHETAKLAKRGRYIHFFPEGELITRHPSIRDFKKGAFKLAVESSVPIIPILIKFERKNGWIKKNKEIITLSVKEPIHPDLSISTREAIEKMKTQAYTSLQA